MRGDRTKKIGWAAALFAAAALALAASARAEHRIEVFAPDSWSSAAAGDTLLVVVTIEWHGNGTGPAAALCIRWDGDALPAASYPVPPLTNDVPLVTSIPVVLPWTEGRDWIAALTADVEEAEAETLTLGTTGPVQHIDVPLLGGLPYDLRLRGSRVITIDEEGSTLRPLPGDTTTIVRAIEATDVDLGDRFVLAETGGRIERIDVLTGEVALLSDPAFPCYLPAAGDSFSIWYRSCCGTFGEWLALGPGGARSTIPLGPVSVGRPSVDGSRAAWREEGPFGEAIRAGDLATDSASTLAASIHPLGDPVVRDGRVVWADHAYGGSRIVTASVSGSEADTLVASKRVIRDASPAGGLLFWLEEREGGWIVRARRENGAIVEVEPAASPRWSLRADRDRVVWLEPDSSGGRLRGIRFDAERFRDDEPLPAAPEFEAKFEALRVYPDRVVVEWSVGGDPDPMECAILRSFDGGAGARGETEVDRRRLAGAGYYFFIDRDLPFGSERQRVRYTLLFETPGGSRRVGSVAALLPERFASFALEAAGPNPSRGDARFSLDVPAPAPGGICGFDVFDGRGRRVRGVDLGALRSGRMEVTWDGRCDGGRPAPPGVYFVRVRAGVHFRETKKVVLLAPGGER